MKEYINKLHKHQMIILDEVDKICKENNLDYFLIGGTLLGAVRHKGFIPWDDDIDIAMPREDYNRFLKISNETLSERFQIDYCKTNKNYWLPFAKVRLNNTIHEESVIKSYKGNKGIWLDIFPLDDCNLKIQLETKEKLVNILKNIMYVRNAKQLKEYNGLFKKITVILLRMIPNRVWHFIYNRIVIGKNGDTCFVNFGSQYGIKKQTHPKEKYFPVKELEFEGKLYKVPNDYEYILTKIYGPNYMELPPVEKRVTHNPLRIVFEDGEEINFEKV